MTDARLQGADEATFIAAVRAEAYTTAADAT